MKKKNDYRANLYSNLYYDHTFHYIVYIGKKWLSHTSIHSFYGKTAYHIFLCVASVGRNAFHTFIYKFLRKNAHHTFLCIVSIAKMLVIHFYT